MAGFLFHVRFRTGVCLLLGTRGRGGSLIEAQSAREKSVTVASSRLFLARCRTCTRAERHRRRQRCPLRHCPIAFDTKPFPRPTFLPLTATDRPAAAPTALTASEEARDIWSKVALSFPASWGRQAGGQGCPVILGWLGCDHPKRKKGAPCPVACFHNLALNEPPNASAKQVKARSGGGNTRHTGATTDAHTSTRLGPCPGGFCALQVWLHLELVVCRRPLQA